jgi:hypothetical protein
VPKRVVFVLPSGLVNVALNSFFWPGVRTIDTSFILLLFINNIKKCLFRNGAQPKLGCWFPYAVPASQVSFLQSKKANVKQLKYVVLNVNVMSQ